MFNQLKSFGLIAVVAYFGYTMFFSGGSSAQTVDLGQVLDRTEFSLENFQKHLEESNVTDVTDESMNQFSGFYAQVLNNEPRFYEKTLGVNVMEDASFVGYEDANANGIQDTGEIKAFTVEIDEANNRLIATDESGGSSGLHFSGAGFLAGALIGNLLGRQRGAGIAANSFNNRKVTPRSSYKAPRSSRSGGLRAGK